MFVKPARLLAWGCAVLVALALSGCTVAGPGGTPTVGPAPAQPTGSTSALPSTTPGSQVTPGGIDQTVAPGDQGTAKPVELNKTQRSGGVAVSLQSIKNRQMKGVGPGEISGPSLVVTVLIRNSSKDDLSVDSAFVNVTDAKGQAGSPFADAPAQPFAGTISAGESATGVYVFRVDTKARSPIRVTVTYSPSHKAALFIGNAH